MEKDNGQPVDPKNNYRRVQNTFCSSTTSLSYTLDRLSIREVNGISDSNSKRNNIIIGQESYRTNPWTRFPLSPIYRAKKDRRPTTGAKSSSPKSVHFQKVLQNRDYPTGMQINSAKQLSYVNRFERCLPACTNSFFFSTVPPISMEEPNISVQDASIRFVSQPSSIHQDTSSSSSLGTSKRDSDISLPRRRNYYGENQGTCLSTNISGTPENVRARPSSSTDKIHTESNTTTRSPGFYNQHPIHVPLCTSSEASQYTSRSSTLIEDEDMQPAQPLIIYRQSTTDDTSRISRTTQDSTSFAIEKSMPSSGYDLDNTNCNHSSRVSRPTLVDQPLEQMEWSVFSSRSTYTRDFYGRIESRMGDYIQSNHIEGNLDTDGTAGTYQLQGTTSHMEMCENLTASGSGTKDLLRQCIGDCVRTSLWGDSFSSSDGTSRQDLEPLSLNQYSSSSHVHTIGNQSSRRTFTSIDNSNRMADKQTIFSSIRDNVGETSRRLLCEFSEPSNNPILQLEMGPTSLIEQRLPDPMESVEPGISLSSLEPHTSLPSTLEPLPNISNNHHTQLVQRDLVPSTAIHDINTTDNNSPIYGASTCIRRQSFTEEPTMEPLGLECKRRRLEEKGYDDNALAILINPEAQPSTKSYNLVQTRFI